MKNHALLCASGAHRWLACPPSARREAEYPDNPGEAAREGTLAHELAVMKLTRLLMGQPCGRANADLAARRLYRPEMEGYTDDYAAQVFNLLKTARQSGKEAMLYLERRVDYGDAAPEGFGTADAIVTAPGMLHIADLKYGRAIQVEASENPQLRLYAWGAYREFGQRYAVNEVTMHIIQPRLKRSSWETMRTDALEEWVRRVIVPTAKLAYLGEGTPSAGRHCRFCRARADCGTYRRYMEERRKERRKERQTERRTEG